MNKPSRARFIHTADIIAFTTEAEDRNDAVDPDGPAIESGVTCLVVDKGGGRQMNAAREQQEKHVRVLFPDPHDIDTGNAIRHVNRLGKTRILLVNSFRDDLDMGRLYVAECTEFVP